MEMELKNMTKATLSFMSKEGEIIQIKSDGGIEMEFRRGEDYDLNVKTESGHSIKVNKTHIARIENLPPKKDGVIYVVPTVVYNTLGNEREDFFTVDEPYRDSGKISFAKAISKPVFNKRSEDMAIITCAVRDIFSFLKEDDESIFIKEKLMAIVRIADRY